MIAQWEHPITATSLDTKFRALDISIVDQIARRVVVSAALVLDVATTLIRIAKTTMQIVLPEASRAFGAHTNGVLSILFYSYERVARVAH